MNQAYAIEYRDLYQRHWWWRAREEEILRQLSGLLGRCEDHRILDVGCGDGLLFEKLQSFGSVTGVEADPNTMTADSRWRNQIYCQRFDQSFQPSQRFDVILMLDILEHLPNPQAAIRHACSLLTDGGYLIATVPAFNELWTSHDDLNHHEIRYTKQTFCPLITAGGFRLLRAKYLFHWTCPAKLVIRCKEWLAGAEPKPPQVPSAMVNQICLGLTKLEQATISKLPMPFGSSLLTVGQREH